MMRIAALVAWIYGGLCAGALLLIPATTYGWMGVVPDPDAGTFAFILGLPWSLVLQAFAPLELWQSILLVMLGMAMNILIILWLGYRRSQSRHRL